MNLADYRRLVDAIPFGKRLPSALYVYRDSFSFGDTLDGLIARLAAAYHVEPGHNVLKFRTDELKISFLAYPQFMTDPHPGLRHAITIDLATGKSRHIDYSKNPNPPILHRKETLLPPDHPRRAEFEALTRTEEQCGLYEDTTTIGFRANWERLLASKGLKIENGTLISVGALASPARTSIRVPNLPPNTVGMRSIRVPNLQPDRHKTALTRYDLSKPVKTLLQYGLIEPHTTVFDYGCGQGSDIRGLQSLGYTADGWDPAFRREVPKTQADIVNLGYVINVIEDPAERLEALIDAYRHSKRLLVVSALINETVQLDRSTAFRDGVLTKRNTFQKYFEQQELQQYIEDALETTAVPVALGIFYVFRNPAEQQDFLSARSKRGIDWSQITARLGLGAPPGTLWKSLYEEHRTLLDAFGKTALNLGRFPTPGEFPDEAELIKRIGSARRALRAFVLGGGLPNGNWAQIAEQFGIGQPAKTRWEILYEQHKELFDAFWEKLLQLGRIPAPEEFAQFADVARVIGSAKKAVRLFLRRGGGEAFKEAAEGRRNDLLVYVALANLRKRVPFGHLSSALRLDIKEFFGNYKNALKQGLELLYAAGDPGENELACENLGIGWYVLTAMRFSEERIRGAVGLSWCHLTPEPDWPAISAKIHRLLN